MTIDEAISKYRNRVEQYKDWENMKDIAEEHKQFAEWLEELKANKVTSAEIYESGYKRGYEACYTKAIDNFAETLKSDEFQKYNLDMVFETSRDLTYTQCTNAFCEYVDSIAEQLKEGGVE